MKQRILSLVVFLSVTSATFLLGRVVLGSRAPDPVIPDPTAPALATSLHGQPAIPTGAFPELTIKPEQALVEVEAGEVRPLDVRSAAGYDAGHLTGALRVSLTPDCVTRGVECVRGELGALGLTGQERLLLYGEAGDVAELARHFWLLEWAGFRDVKILEGGVSEWQSRAGAGLESEVPKLPAQQLTVTPNHSAVVSVDWVRDQFGLAGIEIIDVRDEGHWMDNDFVAPANFTAGHIPYSLPYDFRKLLENRRLPEPEAAWLAFLRLGPRLENKIRADSEFVIYGSGPEDDQLGLAYLTLRRMGAEVRVFAGGWESWSREPNCPKVRIVEAAEVAQRLERENPGLQQDKLPEQIVVLDLREQGAFFNAHIPGAFNLSEAAFDQYFEPMLEQHWPGIQRDKTPLVLYCYGRSCIRSREGANFAAHSGFLDIWWLREGLDNWPEDLPLAQTVLDGAEAVTADSAVGQAG